MRHPIVLSVLALGAAQAAPVKVATTFSILEDFVRSVGGDRVRVVNLVPANGDAHSFQPSTGDVRKLAGAALVVQNGAGFESWFDRLRANAAPNAKVLTLTAGLKLRPAAEPHGEEGGHEQGEEHAEEEGHGEFDPHAWWDVENAAAYTNKIRDALVALDPAGRATYTANAAKRAKTLRGLDAYARRRVAEVPAARRRLVTNHDALGYFAGRYGFTVIGEVFPGGGTERAPSARETARLVNAVKAAGVRAIFTENTVNANLARNLAREAGARVAPPLYTDALGARGSAGDTFAKAFRHNVDTIVGALK